MWLKRNLKTSWRRNSKMKEVEILEEAADGGSGEKGGGGVEGDGG